MGRLIDEDDVLNAVDQRIQELQSHPEFRRKHADIDLYGIKEYISQIPTAQQWIPCSQMLPAAGQSYLVTAEYECGERRTEIDWKLDPECGCEWVGVEKIVAWMEKPEPYMGDK